MLRMTVMTFSETLESVILLTDDAYQHIHIGHQIFTKLFFTDQPQLEETRLASSSSFTLIQITCWL